MRLRALSVLLVAGLAIVASPPANAQSNAALQAELEVTFQQLLFRPSDRALNRRLIELAVRLKDYDTAIGAVERLIFYEPTNASLQLEAARLYLLIGSHAAAAGYLDEAQALGLPPGEVGEARALLARIEQKTKPSIFDAFVQSGVRYQSNANVGAREFGQTVVFTERPVADWNTFAAATVGMNAPVGKNLVIEGSASGYYADQYKINRLDLGFGEVTFGPRLTSDNGSLSIKPYAIAQGLALDRRPYQLAYGGGTSVRFGFAEGWWIEPQAEYKIRQYYNSTNYPAATDQDGKLVTAGVNFRGQFTDHLAFSARLGYGQNRAEADFQSYNQYLGSISFLANFDLFGLENWSFSPFAKLSTTQHLGVAANEIADLTETKRRDWQWGVGANVEIPVIERFKLGVQVEYARNKSNLERYRYENLQVLSGPVVRF